MQHVSHIARTELGFDKFDYHSLRHTHATMLAEKGASPKYVQWKCQEMCSRETPKI